MAKVRDFQEAGVDCSVLLPTGTPGSMTSWRDRDRIRRLAFSYYGRR